MGTDQARFVDAEYGRPHIDTSSIDFDFRRVSQLDPSTLSMFQSPAHDSVVRSAEINEDSMKLEDIEALPTPLKAPRFPRRSTPLPETHVKIESAPFRPAGDVPKLRSHSVGFNLIRQASKPRDISQAQNGARLQSQYSTSSRRNTSLPSLLSDPGDELDDDDSIAREPSSDQNIVKACSDCRKKKKRCLHKDLVDRLKPSAILTPDHKTKFDESTRVKKHIRPHKRTPHDRKNGPSMSKNAVDYRHRKVIQADYRDRFADLIDNDIVKEVDAEGGITPLGRLFKAGVRMMERVMEERTVRSSTGAEADSRTDDEDYQKITDNNGWSSRRVPTRRRTRN